MELLDRTADLNNKGIAAEKAGSIDLAIRIYEENISLGYPATHSYERLMIIYRKRKLPLDELRIIDIAIEIFTKENERRFSRAINDPKNNEYAEEIQLAMEQNLEVKNKEGWCIFNPYPVMKWVTRKDKLIKLNKKPL